MTAAVSEDRIQADVIAWARAHDDQRVRLLFHIPNGGERTAVAGGRLVALGVKRGVSDLFLPAPVYPYSGLWVEMKTATGALSIPQRGWLAEMAAQGYAVAVCRSADDAIATITRYLNGLCIPVQGIAA